MTHLPEPPAPLVRHPLYAACLAADDAWHAEVTAEAERRRKHPGDFRYHPDAEKLPSYPAFVSARDAWRAAGNPVGLPMPRPAPGAVLAVGCHLGCVWHHVRDDGQAWEVTKAENGARDSLGTFSEAESALAAYRADVLGA